MWAGATRMQLQRMDRLGVIKEEGGGCCWAKDLP